MSVIGIVGVSGFVGGNVAAEALRRGHEVIGVSRSTAPSAQPGLTWQKGDITDERLLRELASKVSVLFIAVHGSADGEAFLVRLVPMLLEVASSTGVRLGFVGGAGSLLASADGPRLFDTPEFPEAYKLEAKSHALVLDALRNSESSVDWFYVSPAAEFGSWVPGERTGTYRSGEEVLLTDEDGKSYISGADFGVAILDEIEHPAHSRRRFGVAY